MHPALVKAQQLGTIAKNNEWHGRINHNKKTRTTMLIALRNDEQIVAAWQDNNFEKAAHGIFGHVTNLDSSKAVARALADWPDIVKVLEWGKAQGLNPVEIVDTYKRLPFDPITSDDDAILDCVMGQKIWWWSAESGKIRSETVIIPRRKTQVFDIKCVGHRRMLSFSTADTGRRDVMVDQILKVA